MIDNHEIKPLKNIINDPQVYNLIDAEKHPQNPLKFSKVYDDIENTFTGMKHPRMRCYIKDTNRNIKYLLAVRETPLPTVFSITLMFEPNSQPYNEWNYYHLMRFDFVDKGHGPHTNHYKDGSSERIYGNHVHIMSNSSKRIEKNVIPIGNIDEFQNIKTIKNAFDKFVRYNNIKG